MRKNKNKLQAKIKKSLQTINKFLVTTIINLKKMRTKIKSIWAMCFALFIITCAVSCNVTRTIKTESSYFTKGDTTCTIVTKTIETYDATKKGM